MQVYQVLPEPFTMLDERERQVLLDRWARLLNASRRLRVSFYLLSEQVMGFRFTRYGFYVEASVDPSGFGFRAEPATEPPRPKPVERHPGMLRLEDESWARVYVVHNLPAMLPEAAIVTFYGVADEVHFFLEQLGPREARRRLRGWRARLEAVLADNPSDLEVRRRLEKLAELETMLMGYARLFRLAVVLVVKASSEEELQQRARDLEATADSLQVDVYAPALLQEPLYLLRLDDVLAGFRVRLAPRIIIDTTSLQAFYPFVSEELIHPDGILLGRNLDTGAPIVLDPYAFSNYNTVVIGESGSGKSMTAKIYIRRFRERYGHPVYIVDPEGEYGRVADVLLPGTPVIALEPGRSLGLDPVRLAKLDVIDVRQAVAILREMYTIPRELEGELVKLAVKATSLFEIYDEASSELKRFLEKAVSLDRWVYEGEAPRGLREGAIFDISAVRDRDTKALAGALIASMLGALLTRKALLVVDEGWLFSQYPEVMSLLADVARRGRKRGVNFLFLTQRPQDVLANEHGRTIIENAAVVLLLRLGPVALDAVREVFKLSEAEERFLLDANPGEGLLRAEGWRLKVYVLPTEEELRLFSTRPREEAAGQQLVAVEEVEA